MSKTLRLVEIKCDLASVLVAQGITPMYAERLAECQAKCLHRKHQGERIYWAKGKISLGMDESERKEIYLEWFKFGREKDGESLLATRKICATTLDRIIREGRRKKWGAR